MRSSADSVFSSSVDGSPSFACTARSRYIAAALSVLYVYVVLEAGVRRTKADPLAPLSCLSEVNKVDEVNKTSKVNEMHNTKQVK